MPKYLFHGHYMIDGLKGVLKEGGTGRRDAVAKLAQSMGGTMESFYFAFGDDDYYSVVDLPDNNAAAAVSLAVNTSGSVANKVVVLMSPEDVNVATKKKPSYRPPGQ
jgi:uncharacterized protein with GYD domain